LTGEFLMMMTGFNCLSSGGSAADTAGDRTTHDSTGSGTDGSGSGRADGDRDSGTGKDTTEDQTRETTGDSDSGRTDADRDSGTGKDTTDDQTTSHTRDGDAETTGSATHRPDSDGESGTGADRSGNDGSAGTDGTSGGRDGDASSGGDGSGGKSDGKPSVLGLNGRVSDSDPAGYPRPHADHTVVVPKGQVAVNESFAARTDLQPNTSYMVEGRGEYYTDATGKVSYVKTTFGSDPSAPNPDLMRGQPDTTYVVTPRINDPVPGYNYDVVLRTDEHGFTTDYYVEHIAPGEAARNGTVQRRAGGDDGAYEGGHLHPNNRGGGYEYVNLTEQFRNANRGKGELSFTSLDNLFNELMEGNPGAVTDIRIHVTYPEGATAGSHKYTPQGTGVTYDGAPNPRPTQYDITYKHNGKPQSGLTIPNDPEGWAKATEYIRQSKEIK